MLLTPVSSHHTAAPFSLHLATREAGQEATHGAASTTRVLAHRGALPAEAHGENTEIKQY